MTQVQTERQGRLFEAFNAPRLRNAFEVSPSNRGNRVSAIRRAIADGTYETVEKIDLILDKLIKDVRSGA
jgi:hypothetical protein